jgi:hypothetical protein
MWIWILEETVGPLIVRSLSAAGRPVCDAEFNWLWRSTWGNCRSTDGSFLVGCRETCAWRRMQLTVTVRYGQFSLNTRANCWSAHCPFPVGRRETSAWRRMQLIVTIPCAQVNVNTRANCRYVSCRQQIDLYMKQNTTDCDRPMCSGQCEQ